VVRTSCAVFPYQIYVATLFFVPYPLPPDDRRMEVATGLRGSPLLHPQKSLPRRRWAAQLPYPDDLPPPPRASPQTRIRLPIRHGQQSEQMDLRGGKLGCKPAVGFGEDEESEIWGARICTSIRGNGLRSRRRRACLSKSLLS
jgi:hypothetical protein